MSVTIVLLSLLGCYCDHVVNTQDRQRSLGGRAQRTDLGQSRLQNTSVHIVADLSLHQIQTVPLQSLSRLVVLRSVMVHTEGCNKICRVLGSVDSQGLGDHKKSVGKLGNGQLFAGALRKE